MLEELRDIMNKLYCRYGLINEVVSISKVIDKLIYQEQLKKALK